ncbi:MAG TPA: DNA repair exonuclease [Pirellulales bacterium]|jgi:DNA repair exonuclease SbcCD nuclease subunit|nr:DNA repair exonuclease [Pirellulales bacterium]
MFRFLHAADIHLDSPLRGLERYEGAPIDEIRGATRQALSNLVQLAIDQEVDFVLIAGDLYDGDWRDHRTGLFFVSEMARLRDAGIPVFLIAGNHDAANRMTRSLRLPENVFRFSTKKPETRSLDRLGVSIHGQGFATAACTENLAQAYPKPIGGHFNIGLLHTSAAGSLAHATYAECAYDDLRGKQYDYWALGHIHQRGPVWGDQRIHFSGNVQGRHIRETGAKGCLVVTVDDRQQAEIRFEPLDVLRWERCLVDASEADDAYAVVESTTHALTELVAAGGGRPIAARVEVTGRCRAHEKLASDQERWTNEIRAAVHDLGRGSVWIEKVKFQTSLERDAEAAVDDGPLGELIQYISAIRHDEYALARLGEELADLARRLPGEFKELDGFLRLDDPQSLAPLLDEVQPLLVGRLLDLRSAQGRSAQGRQ